VCVHTILCVPLLDLLLPLRGCTKPPTLSPSSPRSACGGNTHRWGTPPPPTDCHTPLSPHCSLSPSHAGGGGGGGVLLSPLILSPFCSTRETHTPRAPPPISPPSCIIPSPSCIPLLSVYFILPIRVACATRVLNPLFSYPCPRVNLLLPPLLYHCVVRGEGRPIFTPPLPQCLAPPPSPSPPVYLSNSTAFPSACVPVGGPPCRNVIAPHKRDPPPVCEPFSHRSTPPINPSTPYLRSNVGVPPFRPQSHGDTVVGCVCVSLFSPLLHPTVCVSHIIQHPVGTEIPSPGGVPYPNPPPSPCVPNHSPCPPIV
jgi:hypothetical protein